MPPAPEGLRVIVTRPAQQAAPWVNRLRAAHFNAVALPLIEVAPVPDPSPVVAAWQRLPGYDAAMFVSANAVDHFFALKPMLAPVYSKELATKTSA